MHESGEMYLESIYILSKENPNVRSIGVSEYMGFKKSSVSRAVGLLKSGGYLTVSESGVLLLTEEGLSLAQKIYERHTILTKLLVSLGINPDTASDDACKIEHVISDETFEALKKFIQDNK